LLVNILAIFFFLIAYSFFFLSFFYEKKWIFLLLLLGLITFYDFIFINISSFVSPAVLYVIKSWQEYLLLFLLLILFFFRDRFADLNKFDRGFLGCFLFLTLTSAAVGIANGTDFMSVFLGWRMYMMPVLWSFLLYKTSIFKQTPSRLIVYFLAMASIVVVLFGIYQNLTFYDNLRNLWFYDFIDKLNPIEDHPFDFIRDDQLRVTSIFVSPLIYACFLSYTLLLLVFYLVMRKRQTVKRIVAVLLLAFIVYGQILSRTRIGFIILVVGLCCSFLIYFKPSSKLGLSIFIPFLFLITTMMSLIAGVTEDLSALGRLIQYASLASNFVLAGLGFGAELTNVYFDSLYISVFILFGAFALVYLWLYYVLLKKVNSFSLYVKLIEENFYNSLLYYSSYGFFFSFIYTFGFHFSIGSATIQIFYLMLFYFISKFESVETGQVLKFHANGHS
jgi:hypothetical protein